jgi:hypothetical protein
MCITERRKTEDALFLSRRATRFRLAWIGTAIAAVLLAAWIASVPLSFGYVYQSQTPGEGYYFIDFSSGFVKLCHGHHGSLWQGSYWYCDGEFSERKLRWTPLFERDVKALHNRVQVALWVPLLLVATPTAFLWRAARRRPPSHCCQECGYNLTGNTSGTCPECGVKTGYWILGTVTCFMTTDTSVHRRRSGLICGQKGAGEKRLLICSTVRLLDC